MKSMIHFEKFNVNTEGRTSGRMKTNRPECYGNRWDKQDKSFSINPHTGIHDAGYTILISRVLTEDLSRVSKG